MKPAAAMTTIEELGHCADIPIEIIVELDRKIMTVRDILNLTQGSVVKMRRSAGENIDVLVGDALVAFGEIVIIESSVGLRITDFNVQE